MTDVVLNNITSGYNISKINDNFSKLQTVINEQLIHLVGGNNVMQQDLDINGNDLLNVNVLDVHSLTVQGSPLVPSPYVILPGTVNTLSLADGAVTDAKVAANISAAKISYKQLFTGAVDRTLESLGREGASLLDGGVLGDGSDESAKIQAVLNSGKDVLVPEGTFIASGLVMSVNGTRLYGPGTIKKKANVDGVLLTIAADNCVVDGVKFDGTNPQPTLSYLNNIINISGNKNKVVNCTIDTSAGGGITVNATYRFNVIAFNTILNTDDNNIMIAGADASDNLILGNYCDGTTQQNNIFVTASPSSAATTNYNYRNRIIGNTCLNAGDTGIEAGIHSVGCIIANNTVKNSVNPEILTRDSVDCIIVGNYVEASTNASATHDAIALSQQTETNWRYRTIVANNRVIGNLTRSGIYCQGANDVLIDGNFIENTVATVDPTTGAGLSGLAIGIATSSDDITIRNNITKHTKTGVDANYPATALTYNRLVIENNKIYDANSGINIYNCTLNDSTVIGNKISKVVTSGISNLSAAGNYTTIIARNTINTAGYSGASPSGYTNTNLIGMGINSAENVARMLVPETQYSLAILNAGVRRTNGYLSIEFEDGTEDAVFGVSRSTTGKTVGTANLVDSTGSAGSTGWSLFYDGSNNLILQRRAASTGLGPRYFRYRFTKTANEV